MNRPLSPTVAASPDPAALGAELASLVRGRVNFDEHHRGLYATDASIYQVEPLGVVVPADLDDVRAVVEWARDRRLPLLPRGGGTSLAGQAVGPAVVIDFSAHCNRIVSIDANRRRCVVEVGVVLDELNRELKVRTGGRLFFAPDVATGSRANVGGMIGNNSAGARSLMYGRTVEHLIALDVLLPDGTPLHLCEGASESDERVRAITAAIADKVRPMAAEIRRRFPKTRRRVDGYNLDLLLDQLERSTPGTLNRVNLAHLVCGSEGTLAVATTATLNLEILPRLTGLAVLSFPSIDDAIASVAALVATGPAAVELVDEMIIELAERNLEYREYVRLLPAVNGARPGAVLYVEHFADTAEELRAKLDRTTRVVPGAPAATYVEPAAMAAAWKLRKAGEPLLHAIPGRRKPISFIEDTAVDPSRLPAFVRDFRAMVERHGTRASFYAHASVGCLHIRPLLDPKDANDIETMDAISRDATDLVVRYEGALSGEHGDGRARSARLEQFFGPEIVRCFREVKAIFDPEGRMNPGVIVDPPPMTVNLRTFPHGKPIALPQLETHFEFRAEGDFGHATELCNGNGQCRKRRGGTMCPSYMATLEERHSTRGRGNALRLAISGQFPRDDGSSGPRFNDPDVLETLDLCLSCKACKAECPTNVDMARYKAEYLAQSYAAAGGAPWRARMLSRVRRLNRLGSTFAPLSNWVASFGPARAAMNRALGLAPQRSLPPFRRSLYHRLRDVEPLREANPPAVVLFADCFTTYNEPEVGLDAIRLLQAFGYRVIVPRVGCCGRAAISNGMLDHARKTTAPTFERLERVAARFNARAVLVCEPSCLSSITDDWLDLKLPIDLERRERLAKKAFLPEQFIERFWDEHPRRPDPAGASRRRVVFHGHCHQKALWGNGSSAAAMSRFADVEVLDSGCCGMAGAFGYAAERYEVSMAIGELTLLPAVRAAEPEAAIVATGTSCRHQIRDGAGREALHPVQWLWREIAVSQGKG